MVEDLGVIVTCVGGTAVEGKWLTTDIEKVVAASSYLPLSGSIDSGDGIIPDSLAFMDEPANQVRLGRCLQSGEMIRHASFIPTPWNLWDSGSASISLPDNYRWYGSEDVVDQWVKYIV